MLEPRGLGRDLQVQRLDGLEVPGGAVRQRRPEGVLLLLGQRGHVRVGAVVEFLDTLRGRRRVLRERLDAGGVLAVLARRQERQQDLALLLQLLDQGRGGRHSRDRHGHASGTHPDAGTARRGDGRRVLVGRLAAAAHAHSSLGGKRKGPAAVATGPEGRLVGCLHGGLVRCWRGAGLLCGRARETVASPRRTAWSIAWSPAAALPAAGR